jgi:hypothetical protein
MKLEACVRVRSVIMGPEIVAEQQWELFGETALPADVQMCPWPRRHLPEIPLGPLRVVRSPGKAARLDPLLISVDGIELGHRDLEIDDRLRGEPRHRRRTDVIDPQGEVA